MKYQLLLIPPALISLVYGILILCDLTILPLDILWLSDRLYMPGFGASVHNRFISDMINLYLPWKYYMSQFSPESCTTLVSSSLGQLPVWGIRLPNNACYPFEAVRAYSQIDSLFLFSQVTSFFAAYDLSYLTSLVWIYFSFLGFFTVFNPGSHFKNAALAAAGALSFPVVRDLQSDGFSQTFPFLLWALAFTQVYIQRANHGMKFFFLAMGFLFLGITRSSLQTLGFSLLFYTGFSALLFYKACNRKLILALGILVLIVTAGGVFYHLPSIHIFLAHKQHFVPLTDLPMTTVAFHRLGAWIQSWVQFFLGAFAMSFDIVDAAKLFPHLGARVNPSYDGFSFFIHPFFAALFLVSLMRKNKPAMKWCLLWLALDLIVVVTPLFKVVYFRFHQWWMLLGILFLVMKEPWSFTKKEQKLTAGLFLGSCAILFILLTWQKESLLAFLDQKGVMGKEIGFWQSRVEQWISRLSFRDGYALAFILSGGGLIYLTRKNFQKSFLAVLTLSLMVLNLFFYNLPQSQIPFHMFVNYLEQNLNTPQGSETPYPLETNLDLLIRRMPHGRIYESLEIPSSDLEP